MTPPEPDPKARLEALRARFGARATGWWRVAGGRLEQVGFAPAPDMPPAVAAGFAGATRSVPIVDPRLGIVAAALRGEPFVSVAEDLPADVGSGLWLRRFGASRSVAVPVFDGSGALVRVVSVALPAGPPGDAEVAGAVRDEAAGWSEP